MAETIPCPDHGDQPAVAALDSEAASHGFLVCRRCWYREFLAVCLRR